MQKFTPEVLSQNSLKKTLFTLFLLLLTAIPDLTFAQSLGAIGRQIRDQDWISRQQQNRIEKEQFERRKKAIERERARKIKIEEEKMKDIERDLKKSQECFKIDSINLNNAKSLSKKEKTKLFSPFLQKCVSADLLKTIIANAQNHYRSKGLVTARVFVPKQNIRSGNLKLEAVEGKIDEILIGDGGFGSELEKITAFGFLEGEVLNIKDIDQGIYQINRLPSNNAALKIEPSEKDGEALILIENQKSFPARLNIAHDNLGNEFTGVKRTNFSTQLDNLLRLNESINISYLTNLNDSKQKKEIESFSSSISIPFAYYTLSFDYSRTEFLGTSVTELNKIRSTGYSDRSNINLDRVLFSKKDLRISGNLALTTKESASYQNDSKLENSERKLSIADLSFNISNQFENGLGIYFRPSYLRGLKILNAQQDRINISNSTPKAQFESFKAFASLSKNVKIPGNDITFIAATEFDSQYSRHTLFGTEQFSVGGYYSVRGFRENFIVGDSGYFVRNKLGFNLGNLLPFKSQNKFFNFYNLTIEPFYDYGYAKINHSGEDGRLSGAGLKTIFNSKYFSSSLTFSKSISRSALIESDKKENEMIYFELGLRCC